MRRAGFSENTIKNPKNLTESIAFTNMLDKAGLSDEILTKGQAGMAKAAKVMEFSFPHAIKKALIEIDEEDPKWDEEGREKQYKTDTIFVAVSDKKIKQIVESIPGCKLLYIREDHDKKTAIYQAPDYLARKAAYEMVMKARGHYAPEKHEHFLPALSDEEKEEVEDALGLL